MCQSCGLIVKKICGYWSCLFGIVLISNGEKMIFKNYKYKLGGDDPGGGWIPLFCGIHCPQPGTIRDRDTAGVWLLC